MRTLATCQRFPQQTCMGPLVRRSHPLLWDQNNCVVQTPSCAKEGEMTKCVQRAASHAEEEPQCCMGWICVCYCMFYHHALLEAHDSVLGVCISLLTLALTSSRRLVPKETCRETCESRYSAAEQFAAA